MFEVLDCAEYVRVIQLGKYIKYVVCKKCKMSVLLYKFRLFFTVKCEHCLTCSVENKNGTFIRK